MLVNIILPDNDQSAQSRELLDPQSEDMVHRILGLLTAMPGLTSVRSTGGPAFVRVDEWGPLAPPADVPVYNAATRVLSVEAVNADAVASALESLEGVQVHAAVQRRMSGRVVAENGLLNVYSTSPAGGGIAVGETIPDGVTQIHAPSVWAAGGEGAGIRIAVLDTGVGPHRDLPMVVSGATFVPGTNGWHDDNGHGTHVAGTICAMRNGAGVVGVAPMASLIVAKVLDSNGHGTDTWTANAITWAAHQGARVINLSLGASSPSAVEQLAILFAVNLYGVVICAAAGNDNCGRVNWPAANPLCIAVAAVDAVNKRAPFSNCGEELDVSAPGVSVYSTMTGDQYGWMSGTSMATPHASGAAALVLERNTSLSPDRVRGHLMSTALRLGSPREYGAGLIQVDLAAFSSGVGPFDLARSEDLVIAIDIDNDKIDEWLLYRPGYGAASLVKWTSKDQFTAIFDHPEAPGRNVGIGVFDLKRSVDRAVAADVDGDGRDELLLYRPGYGAAALLKWMAADQFTTIFDHPEAPGKNVGIGPFDLKRQVDLVVAADIDGDGKDELLVYRPGYGAAALLKWRKRDEFTTIFDHPEVPGMGIGIGPFDLKRSVDLIVAADVDGDGRDEILTYRPGYGAVSLLKWRANDDFAIIFDHPEAATKNIGIGPFDLKRTEDRIVAIDVDGDGKDEILVYRPGYGAASLLKWQQEDRFVVLFDHPESPGKNVGVGGFDLIRQVDRAIEINIDATAPQELFLYRPGRGAASLLKWQAADTFAAVFNHPDI